MKSIKTVVALATITLTSAACAETFTVHGHERICADIPRLDYALSGYDPAYLDGWTDQDFSDAIQWAESCKWAGVPNGDPDRVKRIRAAQVVAANRRREGEHEQQLAAARTARQSCMETPAYKLFFYEDDITSLRDEMSSLKAQQAQERRISATSGVRNLSNEYAIGQRMVEVEDQLKSDLQAYRDLGGKARSIGAVKLTRTDPCPPNPAP